MIRNDDLEQTPLVFADLRLQYSGATSSRTRCPTRFFDKSREATSGGRHGPDRFESGGQTFGRISSCVSLRTHDFDNKNFMLESIFPIKMCFYCSMNYEGPRQVKMM